MNLGQPGFIQLLHQFKASSIFLQALGNGFFQILSQQSQIDPGFRIHLVAAVELDRRRLGLAQARLCRLRFLSFLPAVLFFPGCTHNSYILAHRQKIVVVHEHVHQALSRSLGWIDRGL